MAQSLFTIGPQGVEAVIPVHSKDEATAGEKIAASCPRGAPYPAGGKYRSLPVHTLAGDAQGESQGPEASRWCRRHSSSASRSTSLR